MGCKTSKLDRLPAVALCRERCKFLDQALSQSYAFADAHVAHMESLKTLASALQCFLNQIEDIEIIETKPPPPPPPLPSHHSHSSSFTSDSDSDSDDAHVLLHSELEAQQDDKEFQIFTRTVSSSTRRDDVDFTNHVETRYALFSPNRGGYYGSNPPPPPPPPPSSSAWDFLNLFEPYERYDETPLYIESGDSYTDVAVKEKEKEKEKEKGKAKVMIISDETEKVKEVESTEEKLVSDKEPLKSEECSSSNPVKVESKKGLCEVVKEIQILFERASDSGNPILEMLDAGKFRYHSKFAFTQVSCKMMRVLTPSNPLAIKWIGGRMGSGHEGVDKDNGHNNGNLCSTLKKLCMWEKKLYHEVKAEEKLRVLHQNKCRQLKRMKKKGTDAPKVESVQTFIGILATKMKISIQVVDKISITISKLREEELWPQIKAFIQMFLRMWKDMQECYRCQYEEIAEVKNLDASTFKRKHSNGHIDAAIKLKSELQNWNLSFSDWIHDQKSLVKALNGWLVRCLMYEPEEIPDDSTPFSPGKIGAPPVFVICNKWSRAVDNLSEKNVMEAVNGFMLRVSELLQKHILDLQQKLTFDKELEKKVKNLERQEQKMQKVVQARERKMAPIAREETEALLQRDDVHQGDFVDTNSIQSDLKQIFSSMESFTASTTHLYEELCQQIQQDSPVLR